MKILKAACLIFILNACFTCSAQIIVDFKDPDIRYMGRIAMEPDAAGLTWSASSVIINFNGTGAKATLKDDTGSDRITVVVDNKVAATIQPSVDKKVYTLAARLPAGRHKLELFKRTEFDKGKLWFYNFDIDGKLLPPPVYKHRMEFYGNSITCGYAIEDHTGKDRGTAEFENGYKSYANITARYFNAEYNSISKSGIGIMVSWFPFIMPDIYNRTVATDYKSVWDFSVYTPELVVVNLFQNDSWIAADPNNPQFKATFGDTPPIPAFIINAYQDFILKIRAKYPGATIICALGSMDATREGSPWPGYIEKAVANLNDKDVFTHFFPYKKTPGHPNEKEQQVMANDLIKFIKDKMKW